MDVYKGTIPIQHEKLKTFFGEYIGARQTGDALEALLVHNELPASAVMHPENEAMVKGAAIVLKHHIAFQDKPEGLVAEDHLPVGLPSPKETAKYYQDHGVTLPWLIVAAAHLEDRPRERTAVGQASARAAKRFGSLIEPGFVLDSRSNAEFSLRHAANELILNTYERTKYNRIVQGGKKGKEQSYQRRNDGASAAPLLWGLAAQIAGRRTARLLDAYPNAPTYLAQGVAAGLIDSCDHAVRTSSGTSNYPPEIQQFYEGIVGMRQSAAALHSRKLREARAEVTTRGLSGRAQREAVGRADHNIKQQIRKAMGQVMVEGVLNMPSQAAHYEDVATAQKRREETARQARIELIERRQKLEYTSSLDYDNALRQEPWYLASQATVGMKPEYARTDAVADAYMALEELADMGNREASKHRITLGYEVREFMLDTLTQPERLQAIAQGLVATGEARFINSLNPVGVRSDHQRKQTKDLKMALTDAALLYYRSPTSIETKTRAGNVTISLAESRMNAGERTLLRNMYVYDLTQAGTSWLSLRSIYPVTADQLLYDRLDTLRHKADGVKRTSLPNEVQYALHNMDRWVKEYTPRPINPHALQEAVDQARMWSQHPVQ